MVQALVKLSENTNRVLNVIKAKYELNDKGEAIEFLTNKYIEDQDEPELKEEFMKELTESKKSGKFIRVDDFEKRYGLK